MAFHVCVAVAFKITSFPNTFRNVIRPLLVNWSVKGLVQNSNHAYTLDWDGAHLYDTSSGGCLGSGGRGRPERTKGTKSTRIGTCRTHDHLHLHNPTNPTTTSNSSMTVASSSSSSSSLNDANAATNSQSMKMKEHEGRELSDEEERALEALFAKHARVKAFPVDHPTAHEHPRHKTVHFVRHAEALHNEAFKVRGRVAYSDPAFLDPELTPLGIAQCQALKPAVEQIQDELELLVVSPLRRTLMTADLAFDKMPGTPWLAHEAVRERIGKNTCDKRRVLKEIRHEYPAIDFGHIKHEEDLAWTPHHRETPAEMAERGIAFLQWLATRPEGNIGVVTHSAFLLTLFTQVLDCHDPDMKRWFENGELRSVRLHL